jgi:thioredoxin 1
MLKAFDSVLASSDLSLERVLNAGLPVALIFYERELPPDLRQRMDELARQYTGKALIVMLARADAPQGTSRLGVRQFPSLVTVRGGKPVTSVQGVQPDDLKPYIAHLLGEGPRPAPRVAPQPQAASKPASAGGPVAVKEADFDREVLRSDRPVLVDFWAPWCGPCKAIAPALEDLATRYKGKVKVAKLNVDDNQQTAQSYGIRGIPTMLIFKGGQVVEQIVGAVPKSRLEESFKKLG